MSDKPPATGGDIITLHTSAPECYDDPSTARTVSVVGRCSRSGHPVRLVAVEARDYDWLTQRYGSGCQRFTVPGRIAVEDYVRFGDWEMFAETALNLLPSPSPSPQPPEGSDDR